MEYGEQEISNWRYVLLMFFIGHVIAMSSTVYNPCPPYSIDASSALIR